MQTSLRKMGNSTGMIVPKPILKLLGVESGAAMDLAVENGRIVATPIRAVIQQGWDVDAQRVATDELDAESEAWLSFGNEQDNEASW